MSAYQMGIYPDGGTPYRFLTDGRNQVSKGISKVCNFVG